MSCTLVAAFLKGTVECPGCGLRCRPGTSKGLGTAGSDIFIGICCYKHFVLHYIIVQLYEVVGTVVVVAILSLLEILITTICLMWSPFGSPLS